MADTIYSFHRAADGAILATATPGNLQAVAAKVAGAIAGRAYVHNGLGVIGAGLCRGGTWHDIRREDFEQCDGTARAAREASGLRTHERDDDFGR